MRPFAHLKSLLSAFGKAPALLRETVVVFLLMLVSVVDIVTPSYIFLTGFYFLPISLAIWYCGRDLSIFVITVSIAITLYMASLNIPTGAPLWESELGYSSFVIAFLGFGVMMFYFRSLFQHLEEESQTDALTGLRSRRNFLEMAQFEISRMARSGDPLTLALIDLDNFKHINDTQGHAAGDALLVAASRCMTSVLRKIDVLGRLGGDEFVILLPGTDANEATAVLERLHSSLKTLLQSLSHLTTASIGAVTVSSGVVLPVTDLMEKADAVMYSVKRASKDGVVVKQLA